jgi:hypothetical protein
MQLCPLKHVLCARVFVGASQLRKQQFLNLLKGVDDLGRALEEDGPAPPPSSAAPMET